MISALLTLALIAAPPDPLADDVAGRAMAAGLRALVSAQKADGSWRSARYGAFKDGPSLSPTVCKALAFAPDLEGVAASRRKGLSYLVAKVGPGEGIYPVYGDSASVLALGRFDVPGGRTAIQAFAADLRLRQLDERFGWGPGDLAFGAWGYAVVPSARSIDPFRHVDADLSSTLFAVSALRFAGSPVDDPSVRAALVFVERCQNFGRSRPDLDDGGFFLTPTDPARNKAGASAKGRFHSYGSATADGLRALLRCGVPPDHPRARASLGWLRRNFSASTVPGVFEEAREADRDATYYYYAWSVAHAFRSLGVRSVDRAGIRVDWADELARELANRQRPDGTWSNRFSASKEDDPLVATAFAVGALGNCRASGR